MYSAARAPLVSCRLRYAVLNTGGVLKAQFLLMIQYWILPTRRCISPKIRGETVFKIMKVCWLADACNLCMKKARWICSSCNILQI